ncbi:CDP-glycerol--glycerophosphate glycerophosphotransferase [Streptomyces sp. CB02923]|uniref:CDP-glycerol glycerophosphotransferase family protein n=1 Tax=Streptomyces sp. CB02923 TaxID=1718985 RepID=UPI00093F48C6|nr:CDP-glycerol glycerophosphotransferase family protein [Streptomyces sp. CB02923]OKI01999.1 CDP-glycerol--glycerophosphate glycerophosphotransferase [Streptomyces sp. CB02923]
MDGPLLRRWCSVTEISVVVIVYNDAERLPVAVESVLGQSFGDVEVVIVDDCSTDGSFGVARGLAERFPGRVRAFQLEENSGAGGEPRNRGIREAVGRYVMFLDSDDVLERDACRNLVEAAHRTGADLVSGLCVRVHVDAPGQKRDEWYGWLYRQTRVLESVEELPDLFVWDTLSTNKCYRRDFLLERGLWFPKGVFYEDLQFIAEAYLAAERIALIPNQVYFWQVFRGAAVKSVTNRRHELGNYAHRLEVHRRIDAMLEERGLGELRRAKDVKFLKHDLVLHLRDLPFRDEEFRREFGRLSAGYLATLDPVAFERAQPLQAICGYLLGRGDWAQLVPAVDALMNAGKVAVPLVEEDGRVYWCGEHLDDALGRQVLDVTGLGYHARPLEQMFLRNELTEFAVLAGGGVRLAGRVVNPLGMIGTEARLGARLVFSARRRAVQGLGPVSFEVAVVRHEGEAVVWEAVADVGGRLRPLGLVDLVWDVRLVLEVDGRCTTTRLSVADVEVAGREVAVRPRLTRMVADHVRPHVSARGHLAFELVGRDPQRARAREWIGRGVRGRPGAVAKSGYRQVRAVRRSLVSGEAKLRAYHEVFLRLPVRKRTVVFESHLGRQFSDSPRAVYEEMRRQGLEFEAFWSYAEDPGEFPAEATLVRRWSLPYLKALAQAEFWVDNQSFPLKLAKRAQTTYVQTWHGSALKKMGFDTPAQKTLTRAQQAEQQTALDRFDRFLIRSEHDVRTLARAFRLPERALLRVGYPRNDALVRARRREEAGQGRVRGPLAAELGIPEDKQVVLYAPTFRSSGARSHRFELPFDVEEFAARFGERFVLLVRSHYLNHVTLPPTVKGAVVDVSALHDVTPLLELADVLVSDYSSVMFDYSLLNRPMVLFTYDFEAYVHEQRGTYFDLREHAPGPLVHSPEAFFEALEGLEDLEGVYAPARARFVARFGEYERGDAARTLVEQFFSHWSR